LLQYFAKMLRFLYMHMQRVRYALGWVPGAVLILITALPGGSAHVEPFEAPGEARARGEIDRLVFAKLKQLGIEPARLCSDAVFVRRVYFDVTGTLPTVAQTRRFLDDRTPDKRRALIDELLAREEFADYWSMKWCDLLRVKAEFPIKLWPNAVQAYHRWIHSSIRDNKPYDQFVRELLTSSGSNFRVPPVNFYRAVQSRDPSGLAAAVALTFMGVRLDQWPEERRAGMEKFFSRVAYKGTAEWKEELVYLDPAQTSPLVAVLPDGNKVQIGWNEDPRRSFADWLIDRLNPWFARNIVNRVWAWLFGRGIIHETDDIRMDNLPVNPELLTLLEMELINADYDLKFIYRLMLNSHTYQQSSIPRSKHPDAEALFAHYMVRQLEAEVLIDALCSLSGTSESYSSPIPEPFTFIPKEQPTIKLADGSITSPFLEMFGRPPRDTGLFSERNNQPTVKQRLHLLNSSHIQNKLNRGRLLRRLVIRAGGNQDILISSLYLAILSRRPTAHELDAALRYTRTSGLSRQQAVGDVAWALINTKEFLYKH